MLGTPQLQWLEDGLVSSNAAFKVVALGNQVLNPLNPLEGMANYGTEQGEMLDWIRDRRIDGVLFLSGDRHHSELIRLDRPGSYPLYDYTSSAFTSGPHVIRRDDPEFANPNRVAGTLLEEHGFGALRFEGPPSDRKVVMRAFDRTGRVKWERAVSRQEISFRKGAPSPSL
jgi:alkaline phosphatase D